MGRYSLRALLSVGLLVVLAWTGIALFGTHGGGGRIALIAIWVIALIAVVGFTVRNLTLARQDRLGRLPGDTKKQK